MKIVLKYQRHPKPRGGWRYPLWIYLACEWDNGEAERLNPMWTVNASHDTLQTYQYPSLRKNDRLWWNFRSNVASSFTIKPEPPYNEHINLTAYYNTRADREIAIEWFHHIATLVRERAQTWLAEHEEESGDPQETTVIFPIDPDHSATEPAIRRHIRNPHHRKEASTHPITPSTPTEQHAGPWHHASQLDPHQATHADAA
jgi:hypothetical protein